MTNDEQAAIDFFNGALGQIAKECPHAETAERIRNALWQLNQRLAEVGEITVAYDMPRRGGPITVTRYPVAPKEPAPKTVSECVHPSFVYHDQTGSFRCLACGAADIE